MRRLFSASLTRYTMALCAVGFTASALAPATAIAQEEDELAKAKRVLALIASANEKFDAGDFIGARDAYNEAFGLYPDPSLLYRLGLTSEKLNEMFAALAYYEQFIDAVPDDKTAKKVLARIDEMKKELPARFIVESTPGQAEVFVNSMEGAASCTTPCHVDVPAGRSTIFVKKDGFETELRNVDGVNAEQKTLTFTLSEAKPQLVDNTNPSGSTESNLGTYGWIAAGTGLAVIGTGAVFTVMSQGATDDVNSYDKRAVGASPTELQGLKDDANSYYDTSVLLYVVGGVLTATGATLIVLDMMQDTETVSLQVAPTVGGAAVTLGGRF